MDTIPTIEELEARFDELPVDIQEAIDSINTTKAIGQIGTEHRLHLDQTQALAACVGYLMLGFIKPQDFIDHLASEVRIPEELAVSIAKEVNLKILNPIKDQLKKAHEEIDSKQKKIGVGDGSVSIFEQKVKHLFDHQPTTNELRPTIRPPQDNDPYREEIA